MNLKEEIEKILFSINKTIEEIDYCSINNPNIEDDKLLEGEFDIEKLNCALNEYNKQNVFGFIVFKDKSWIEKDEFNSNDWWVYVQCPIIKYKEL